MNSSIYVLRNTVLLLLMRGTHAYLQAHTKLNTPPHSHHQIIIKDVIVCSSLYSLYTFPHVNYHVHLCFQHCITCSHGNGSF